ncbi:MBL fold metallo-hydrolase [Amycolatopsis azurea]|uniref:MBL fold metallo-hydrolase n=1 Tax=Amycolatopsis azurea DSM 43854 TaxID=1238180 RepID=M2QHF6_9PSEU|nr:MBL fold metallo-hydrolase [Amycolatopsis azurea]EMD26151.1 putative polyketide cyclase [Amycolatopsis azurea DSM 43854]OOC01400.1 MBL fold metallo-hydrolase [Amycolatopsis azurea DSM 43854]
MTVTSSATTDARLHEVADGVFAYIQPDGGWCLNNAGLIVSGREAALVDTAATEARAHRLRAQVLTVSATAPRVVVNTHSHGDHTFGNFVFPEAVVVGHERTRTEMAEIGLHLTGLWPEVCWGDIEVVLPTLTFRDRLTLTVGRTSAEVLHLGVAHTTNDSVVWLPDQRVVFTGDLAMSGVTPFVMMGSVTGSLEVTAKLRALGAETVVPGHGPVCGPEIFDTTERYLRWVREVARKGIEDGVPALEAARTADLGEFAGLLDSERLVPNLHRAYAEEAGAEQGAALDVATMFGELIEYHGSLPACHA